MSRVHVLSEEPALSIGLDASEAADAELRCTAPVEFLEAPKWSTDFAFWSQRDAVRLVLDGFGIRRVVSSESYAVEVVGPGHIVTPVICHSDNDYKVYARTITEMRFAVLDRRFLQYAARWPEVLINIAAMTANRASELSALAALTHGSKLDTRVYQVLRHLANRWGRVNSLGVQLPFRLSQQELADLVGARRPSVASSLGRLRRESRLIEPDGGGWIVAAPMTESRIDGILEVCDP